MWSPKPRSPTCRGLNLLWIIAASAVTVTLWSGSIANVHGAPAKLDAKVTPFPLELQAPQFADAVVGDNGASSFSSKPSAVDSYGNPIEALKPIDTPDGRKVVSAQGLQFEIPNYASGITELKQPSDDLLPPFIDPIAVAVPNESAEGVTAANAGTTTVHVESAHLVEIKPQQQQQQQQQRQQLRQESSHSPNVISADSKELPSYLLDLNDPNIGGPVDYAPLDEGSALKVIAWDLLPPLDTEPQIITAENYTPKRVIGVEDPKTHNIPFSLTSNVNVPATVPQRSGIPTEGSVSIVELNGPIDAENPHSNRGSPNRQSVAGVESSNGQAETPTKATANQYQSRGNVHYTSTTTTTTAPRTTRPSTTTTTTSRPTTTTTTTSRPTTTTTTTSRPTTTTTTRSTTTTTTTRRPTTTTTRRPITPTTTAVPLNPADFYQLEHGDSYTLPSWLAGIDDPELDAAVGYVVPDDINEYNHTIDRDLLPPLEPFTDLNIINLAAPADQHTTAQPTPATFTTTSTTTTKRTTTTRRPTVSTSKPHWVRAQSTAATSTSTTTTTTTPKPISLNTRFTPNQFAPSEDITSAASPPKSDSNTVSSTSTTTTTTTQKPRTATPSHQFSSFNAFNQNIPTTTTAPLDSSAAVGEQNPELTRGTNPFLPNPFLPIRNTGPNKPKPFTATGAGRPIATTSTSTTTTTTTAATPVYDNPFNTATTPPWLADFDYPELGPGVPFVYDPTKDKSAVSNNLQPPSQLEADAMDTSKPVFVTSSPTSLNSFQAPPSFAHQPNTFASSSGSFSSNFPSKATIPTTTSTTPHPFTQTGQQANDNVFKQSPDFFTPPTAVAESEVPSVEASQINTNVNPNNVNANNNNPQLLPAELAKKTPSSSFNKHFAAPFEPSAPASVGLSTPSVDQEAGGSTKTTFTKSNDGKVISSNAFPQGAIFSPTPTKPFGFGNSLSATQPQQKDLQASRPNQFGGSSTDFSSTFNKAATPSGFSSFASSTFSSSSSTFGSSSATAGRGKYTGTFGGAPGVLGGGNVGYAVQADGSIRDPTQAYRPIEATAAAAPFVPAPTVASKPAFGGFANPVATATAATSIRSGVSGYKSKFGGPPGILVPYDNIKGGKP